MLNDLIPHSLMNFDIDLKKIVQAVKVVQALKKVHQ